MRTCKENNQQQHFLEKLVVVKAPQQNGRLLARMASKAGAQKLKLTNEKWKVIKMFDGFYEVSNRGRVRSVKRVVERPNDGMGYFYVVRKSQIMSQRIVGAGYFQVVLQKYRKRYCKYVANLVADAFIPNPKNKVEVNHKDGNKNGIIRLIIWNGKQGGKILGTLSQTI